MKSHGFRFIVLLACTIYHGGLLLLLNMNLKQTDCQWKEFETLQLSHDSFDLFSRHGVNKSANNSSEYMEDTTLDYDIFNGSKLSMQSIRIQFEGTTAPLVPAPATYNDNNPANYMADRSAWLVFCVTRWEILTLHDTFKFPRPQIPISNH